MEPIAANTPEVIKQSTDLLNSSNSWGVTPIVIFFSILTVTVVIYFVKTLLKAYEKTNEVINKNTQGYEMLKSSIEKANELNSKLIDNINDNLEKSIKLHTKTHFKLDWLQERLKELKC